MDSQSLGSQSPPSNEETQETTQEETANEYSHAFSEETRIPSTPISSPERTRRTMTPQRTTEMSTMMQSPSTIIPGTPNTNIVNNIMSLTPLSEINDVQVNDNIEEGNNEATQETVQDAVIWGTDVNVPTAEAAFKDFIHNFISLEEQDSDNDDSSTESNTVPYYMNQLQNIYNGTSIQSNSLDINCIHLFYHSSACERFYEQLLRYPQEIIPLMDMVVNRIYQSFSGDEDGGNRIQVRPYHLKTLSHMRQLDPVHIDTLIAIRGMVVRTSPLIPDLKVALFQCSICGALKDVMIDRGRIVHPNKCDECQSKNSFGLEHNRSSYTDKQMVRLQETPDEVPAGETPASILLLVYDSLVDSVRPGDRVEVTGVFRAQPRRVHPRITKVNSVYKTYLDVIHFRKMTKGENALGRGISLDATNGLTPARIAQLESIASSPDIYERLMNSLAPSIWELDDVKKGVLCMLFGGNSRRVVTNDDSSDEEDTTETIQKRGEINILLCGDPGTSKSQLLSYVHKLAPRGVYTSGKGSSAVGLTASVVRDPDTRDLVLESGALVLSDHGICCIDEFDKMDVTTRAILHEAMEQQTVSIAKAGIIATLNARTAVLASANPLESRYNPAKSVVENITLPPTLLSRFDLIYLILDTPNVETDRRLAQHLVSLYAPSNANEDRSAPLDHATLRDYITYARKYIHPTISDLASQEFLKSYLAMRRAGASSHTISATPRQLESLIRISEALAKMRFSRIVERRDVLEAVRLMQVATQAAATDPRTGRIDMDMITTGRTAMERKISDQMYTLLKELLGTKKGEKVVISELVTQCVDILNVQAGVIGLEDVVEQLRVLEMDGVLQFVERGSMVYVRPVVA